MKINIIKNIKLALIMLVIISLIIFFYKQSLQVVITISDNYFETHNISNNDFLNENSFVHHDDTSPKITTKNDAIQIVYNSKSDYYNDLYYSLLATNQFFMQIGYSTQTNLNYLSFYYEDNLSFLSVLVDTNYTEDIDFEELSDYIALNTFKTHILISRHASDMTISFADETTKSILYTKTYPYE